MCLSCVYMCVCVCMLCVCVAVEGAAWRRLEEARQKRKRGEQIGRRQTKVEETGFTKLRAERWAVPGIGAAGCGPWRMKRATASE